MEFADPRPRLPAITSLRYFAALHVAIFHIREIGGLPGPAWFQGLASIGYVGVSFFFVLSGFILVYTYAGRTIAVREFWRARFARIYPAYAFSLLITFPFFFYGSLKMHVPFFAFSEKHFGVSAGLVLALLQSWVPPAALAWNPVAWSLSVEAFFYLLFPFLLIRYSRLSRTALWTVIVACWLAGLAISAGYMALRPASAGAVTTQDWSAGVNFVKFFPVARLPEFLMGMACGWLFLRRGEKAGTGLLPVLAGLGGVAVVVAFAHRLPYLVIHTAILGPAFAAIVYGIALEPSWASWLNNRVLVLFGDASYSFYLLHSMMVWPFFHDMRTQAVRNQSFLGLLVWTAMATSVAILVYKFIEEPARRRLRRKRTVAPTIKQAAGEVA